MRSEPFLLIASLSFLAACGPTPPAGDDAGSRDAGSTDAGSPDAATSACSEGLSECGGACVDLASSAAHCGDCATECSTDEVCTAGACTLACGSDRTACDGACVSTASDPVNCGACGHACATDEVCNTGTCALECSGGLVACGASCVDLSTDRDHCGDCTTACTAPDHAQPVCARSECAWECQGGFDDCDGDPSNGCEADLSRPETCGSCASSCASGPGATAICESGACALACATDRVDCDGDASNGCEVDATTIGVASVAPASGETLIGREPTITVTFTSAIDPAAGTLRLMGDMGTDITFDLATAPPEIVFSAGNTVMEIQPARTFPWGETLTLSWAGLHDARCGGTRGEIPSPTWSITVNPCEPGRAGMIGTTRTDLLPATTGHPTEVYLAVDARADGYAYVGGITELSRLPKTGGAFEPALFTTTGISALSPVRPGYKLLSHGDDLFWLSRDRGSSGMVFRLSSDGGATWSAVDYAHFAQIPSDDFRGIAAYEGTLYLLTHEDSAGVESQIYAVPATGTVPAEGTLAQSFEAGESFCGGLAVDDTYFYATCAGAEHLLRIHRTTGAVDVLPALTGTAFPPMTDTTTQALAADDVDGDGRADYLYVQTEYEETYVVCAPAGPLSEIRTRSHFDFGMRNGNYGMSFDPAARRLWLFQDRADTVFSLE